MAGHRALQVAMSSDASFESNENVFCPTPDKHVGGGSGRSGDAWHRPLEPRPAPAPAQNCRLTSSPPHPLPSPPPLPSDTSFEFYGFSAVLNFMVFLPPPTRVLNLWGRRAGGRAEGRTPRASGSKNVLAFASRSLRASAPGPWPGAPSSPWPGPDPPPAPPSAGHTTSPHASATPRLYHPFGVPSPGTYLCPCPCPRGPPARGPAGAGADVGAGRCVRGSAGALVKRW